MIWGHAAGNLSAGVGSQDEIRLLEVAMVDRQCTWLAGEG